MKNIQSYASRKTIRQTLISLFSRVIGILLGFVVSMINTRYLSTDEYGKLRFIGQILLIMPLLMSFGFSYSAGRLVACKEHSKREVKLVRAMFFLSAMTSIISCIALFLFSMFVDNIFNTDIRMYIVIIAPFSIYYIVKPQISNLLQGQNRIMFFSIWEILPQFIYAIVAGIFIWKFSFSLTISIGISLISGIIICLFGIIYMAQGSFVFSKSDLLLILKENRFNGIHVYIGGLSSVLLAQAVPLFVGYYANMESVAYYGLALTISSPLALLPSTIATVKFKTFANSATIPKKIIISTILISVFFYLCYCFSLKYLISMFYPVQYIQVVPMGIILGLGVICHGFGDLFNRFLGAHGLGKKLRNGAFLTGFTIFILSVILMPTYGAWGGVWAKGFSSLVYLCSMIVFYMTHLIHQRHKEYRI